MTSNHLYETQYKQRLKVGHARGTHANFPAQNHKKQTPCKISKGKLNCTWKSVKGNKRSKKGKLETFSTQSLFK